MTPSADTENTTLVGAGRVVAELAQAPPGSLSADLAELAAIGGNPQGGVTRVAWSSELFDAYEWVARHMRALGLTVHIDAAGNLIGVWNVGRGAPLVVGSHLDTVPVGGALDGALGVVAAVHAVRRLQKRGISARRPLWIVAFMDEEGTRFDTALFGSQAFTGQYMSGVVDRIDEDGISLKEAMRLAGHDHRRIHSARRIDEVYAYLELHIEQGPVLANEDVQIGAVTSIVGLRRYRVILRGRANHAGTTPMRYRRDALIGAARVALELREFARAGETLTSNVGEITVDPGGANVVPGRAEFTIDIRATTVAAVRDAERFVHRIVHSVAADELLEAELEPTLALDPVALDPTLVAAVERAASAEGASCRRLASGAGHDAMLMSRHVPTAMIFVPSADGISHSPDEYTRPGELELGMRVLSSCVNELLERG